MKSASAVLFATAVAAEYGYGAPASSSKAGYVAPVTSSKLAYGAHVSSAKPGYNAHATSSKLGYTTIYPGHGKPPCTVTAQYQPVPTYVNGEWSEYEAISTVITDAYGKKMTVTATDEDLTVYHTKKTLTHTVTAPVEGYAKPTGYGGGEKAPYVTKTWDELFEEIHVIPYNHVGPHGIPGYSGNPKCEDKKDEQWVTIKEYSGGKWHTKEHTFTYSAPKPSVTTYDAPGVYTVPANDITVAYPTAVAAEETYHAVANKPITYGGQTTDVTKPTTITAAYAAYETHGAETKTVVHTKTITCNEPGKYTIVKPTTTVYAHDTTFVYPTVTNYPAGVYHHSAETVTITKAHQPYTCSFEQTSTYAVPTAAYTHEAYSSATEEATSTKPYGANPSSDYEEPAESYGHASAGYVKRGGVLQRRKAEAGSAKAGAKRVILV